MTRDGAQFGPDITFPVVPRYDWADPETFAGADVVVLGAPFDGGTSHRPGTRFGPQYIRQSCYLPHDGSRPSLALRVDALRDLAVHDAGDVEMYSGDAERSVRALRDAVYAVTAAGAIPLVLGRDHTIASTFVAMTRRGITGVCAVPVDPAGQFGVVMPGVLSLFGLLLAS